MSATFNMKGTNNSSFTIGKGGLTIYQGTGNPTNQGNDGDIFVQKDTGQLYTHNSSIASTQPSGSPWQSFITSQPTSNQNAVKSISVDENGRPVFISATGSSIISASLLDLKSISSGGSSSTSNSSMNLLSYITNWYWADTLNFTLDEEPTILHLVGRTSGGAGNAGSFVYPGGLSFKYPPVIFGIGGDLPSTDWDAGKSLPMSNINITSQTKTGFTFNHPGGWPGYNYEVVSFIVIGILNKSS